METDGVLYSPRVAQVGGYVLRDASFSLCYGLRSGKFGRSDDVLPRQQHHDCNCNRQHILRGTGKMKKPVCDFNCFECPHPDCICDDFTHKEFVTDAQIDNIAGIAKKKTGFSKREYGKKYYAEHREYAKAYQRRYYEENKEQI